MNFETKNIYCSFEAGDICQNFTFKSPFFFFVHQCLNCLKRACNTIYVWKLMNVSGIRGLLARHFLQMPLQCFWAFSSSLSFLLCMRLGRLNYAEQTPPALILAWPPDRVIVPPLTLSSVGGHNVDTVVSSSATRWCHLLSVMSFLCVYFCQMHCLVA